jgi:hypothetical protein
MLIHVPKDRSFADRRSFQLCMQRAYRARLFMRGVRNGIYLPHRPGRSALMPTS